jgi:hypothetical protein
MTKKTKTLVWGAIAALASYVPFVLAQDDLDALLNELDPAKESKKVEEKAAPQAEKAATVDTAAVEESQPAQKPAAEEVSE